MNTAQDLVAYLLSATGGGAQDGEHHAVRQAVIHGVREVMQCRDWLWHVRNSSFTTYQNTTTGTITAGSKDIVVANATGFVPGRVVGIGAFYFPTPIRIAAVSGNVVTVDVAARQSGSGVTLQPQTYYDLPPDVKDIDALVTNTVGTLHCYITPQEWQRLEINTRGAGEPYYYTIMRSDMYPDRYQVRFVGVPVENTVVHYTYRVIPKQIKYMGYERICRQGTVSVALNSLFLPIVTGVGTAFPKDCVGSYIRFGSDGMDADAAGAPLSFVMERRIDEWLSTSQLRVSQSGPLLRPSPYGSGSPGDFFDGGVVGGTAEPPPVAPSIPDELTTLPPKTKYAITDVIDCSPQMYTAILSAVEMWYARVAGKPADGPAATFSRDLRIAMENDVVSPRSGRNQNTWYPTARSMGWHSPMLADIE